MVVLDAIHDIQAKQAPDLAVRWNCKAGRCGSCSAEINGKPRLMCMTRMTPLPEPGEPITVTPMKAFPLIKDLVTDVSLQLRVAKKIPPFKPRPRDADGTWRMQQEDIDRIQEFRKCIECFLCQDVCHVIRDHDKKTSFAGPRFLIHARGARHAPARHARPARADQGRVRHRVLQHHASAAPRCAPSTSPSPTTRIIPLKERVADDYYDPVRWVLRKVFPPKHKKSLPVVPSQSAEGPDQDEEERSARTPRSSRRTREQGERS